MTNAIPKMIKNATPVELIEALNSHLEETQNHFSKKKFNSNQQLTIKLKSNERKSKRPEGPKKS